MLAHAHSMFHHSMGSVHSCLIVADFAYFIYRRQQEAETKIIEEETAKRVEEAIRKKVHDALHSEEFKKEMELKIQEGRKKIIDDIAAQLEREKEEALAEARRKEVDCLNPAVTVTVYYCGVSSDLLHIYESKCHNLEYSCNLVI